MENILIGDSKKLILRDENTKKPPDWKTFNDKKETVNTNVMSRIEMDCFSVKLRGRKLFCNAYQGCSQNNGEV